MGVLDLGRGKRYRFTYENCDGYGLRAEESIETAPCLTGFMPDRAATVKKRS
jgi:hypothetical protein